ncbi:MAG: protein rep [Clostridia bacterium]|nr:protein rep [Clostridia bacterium]
MKKGKGDGAKIEWEFGIEWFQDLQSKVKYNEFQSEYYQRMSEESHDESYKDKSERVLTCSKTWNLNYYVRHGLKQIKSIVRCQDAFCYVCQELKAQRRFQIYAPVLREFERDHDIFHVVFTVPNVAGERLNWTLDKMYSRFSRVIAYLNGDKKIKGLDFYRYGYVGAVRALEITTGERKDYDDFHPHFHCMFVLAKDPPNMEKRVENSFSIQKKDGKIIKRYFSKFECLLQRIWCLLMLDEKVTKENIRDIYTVSGCKYKDGFDVAADDACGEYHEIFKYAIKGTYKKEKIFDYEDFCRLENALKNRRIYETYGCLRQYNFNEVGDVSNVEDMYDVIFEAILKELQRLEKPIVIQSCIEEIIDDLKGNKKRKQKIKYIGPSVLRRAFQSLSDLDKETCLEKVRKVLLGNVQEEVGEGFVRLEN